MPWLIGLAVVALVGWYASKHMGGGSSSTSIHTVAISSTTAQGPAAQVSMGPTDSLMVNVYTAPAGYAWNFAPSGLTLVSQTPTSASFALAPSTMGGSIVASLFRSPNTGMVAPLAAYSIAVGNTAMPKLSAA